MVLKLYRRHRIDCEGNHPEDSRSGEFEEGRRGWKKCACLIHASGTLQIYGISQNDAVDTREFNSSFGVSFAMLLDSCLGCVVHSTLPAGTGYTDWLDNYVSKTLPGIADHPPTVDVQADLSSTMVTVTVKWYAPSKMGTVTIHQYIAIAHIK